MNFGSPPACSACPTKLHPRHQRRRRCLEQRWSMRLPAAQNVDHIEQYLARCRCVIGLIVGSMSGDNFLAPKESCVGWLDLGWQLTLT